MNQSMTTTNKHTHNTYHKRTIQVCFMGKALEEVIEEAFAKDLTKRPCSILVLTAGRPEDRPRLEATLRTTVQRLAQTCATCPLSITMVQVGDSTQGEAYLQHLDARMQASCVATGDTFDLVDTIQDHDIQAAMGEIQGAQASGKNGALVGAFAGAAMGVGGMYLYNKQQAKKRTTGWSGQWTGKRGFPCCSVPFRSARLDSTLSLEFSVVYCIVFVLYGLLLCSFFYFNRNDTYFSFFLSHIISYNIECTRSLTCTMIRWLLSLSSCSVSM